MHRDELETLWWVVLYVGALVGGVTLTRTLFVPPRGTTGDTKGEKSPFQLWLEFSRERAQHELEADLEKYRIDKGLIHRRDRQDTP
jgi:hypothetical protein